MYDPKTGTFLRPDPLGFDSGDYNLFRYCRNNPINLTDPSGLQSESELPDAARMAIYHRRLRLEIDLMKSEMIGNTEELAALR